MTNQEAIERLKNARSKCVSSLPEIQEMYDMFDKAIEALETQKIGHWIRWYNQKDFGLYIENIPHCKCSECNKEYDPHTSLFIKYCSQCGAKMEGK